MRVEGELFSGDYLKSLLCWALGEVPDSFPTKNYCEKKPVLFYAWNRWRLNAKCAFGWMLDGSCPWHQSLNFIVRLRKQQLFCLKVGLSYICGLTARQMERGCLCAWMSCSYWHTCYRLQFVTLHKAGNCSTGVQAIKSSWPALHYPLYAPGVYMNGWIKGEMWFFIGIPTHTQILKLNQKKLNYFFRGDVGIFCIVKYKVFI